MQILLSGSHGLVGRALTKHLLAQGHDVVALVRDPGEPGVYWDPRKEDFNLEDFEGFDAVVHLAGENIAKKRWTTKVKDALFLSRCRDTWLLSHLLCRLKEKPKVLLTASAVGYYGDRGDVVLDETSGPGKGFLANLCVHWEEAALPASRCGIRTVQTRFGGVLSSKGGLLAKMLPIFRLGLGGKIGSGNQYMSWIAIGDLVRAIEFLLTHEEHSGAFNLTAPEPLPQDAFAHELAKSLGRPCIAPLPAFAARLLFGDMADELLLSGQRVIPNRLLDAGFEFEFRELSAAFDSFRSAW